MPRITEFQRRHPEILLMLNPTVDVVELRPGGVDLAIRYCDRERVKDEASIVLTSDMVVVGAPSLLERHTIEGPSSFMRLPWLQELGTNEAVNWFERRGITVEEPLMVSQMPGNLIMEAVRRGNGITYTARAFFREDIKTGRVKVLYSELCFGVYFVEANPSSLRSTVRTFLNWLVSESETVTT